MIAFADLAGQSALIGQLQSDFARGSYVHAYLLTGPGGTGKRSAAQLCAMAALCRGSISPAVRAARVGACFPARIPDVHTVVPEKGKQIIGVGVMREMLDTVSVKSFEDGAKVILIPKAETDERRRAELPAQDARRAAGADGLLSDDGSARGAAADDCFPLPRRAVSSADGEACAARLIALGQPPETAKKKARMAEGCVGRALESTTGSSILRRQLTRDVFSVHRPADVLGVVNAIRRIRNGRSSCWIRWKSRLRDILVQQAGGASVADAGYAREAEAYAVPDAAFRRTGADGNAAARARDARRQRRVCVGV